MKTLIAAMLAAVALASPSYAQDTPLAGVWKVSAKVASVPFKLLCRFELVGDKLGGACVEPASRKSHPLTAVKVDGEHIAFTHGGSFLLNKFDVNYTGVVDGDHMSGQIAVFGHTGDFVAVRDAS